MSNLIPEKLTTTELVEILRDMADRVESGDSFEGHIEYLIPEMPEWAERGEPKPEGWVYEDGDKHMVRGTYRIGNTMGQGGVRMIGSVPE